MLRPAEHEASAHVTGRAASSGTRWPELVVLGALYSGLTAWWLWPLPRVWTTHAAYFFSDHPAAVADFYLIVWALAWDTHALLTAPWSLFDANAFHPAPLSLAYSEHFLGYVPLFAPTYLLSGNPILAVNLLVFLTYPLSALGAYALARRWSAPAAAAVAGFFFAFWMYRYMSMPHLHQLGILYFPLVILFTERWLDTGRTRELPCLSASLALQMLSSIYLAYAILIAWGCYLPTALWRWRRRLDRRRLIGLALAGAVPLGLMVAASLPYLRLRDLGLIPAYDETQGALGLNPYFGSRNIRRYLQSQGVGVVGYALAALAILPPWRRGRRWPVFLGVLLAVVGYVAASGPNLFVWHWPLWTPYELLMKWIPGFSTIRLPIRFVVVAQLGLALLAGLGFARLFGAARPALAWAAVAATVTAALVSFGPFPTLPTFPTPTAEGVPAAYRWLAVHGDGRALLEIPGYGFDRAAKQMYLSTYHWLPIVNGYSAYWPRTRDYIHGIAARLPAPAALQDLVDVVDVGWILVHRAELPPQAARPWDGPQAPGLDPVGYFGDDLLYRVTLPAHTDRRSRVASPDETFRGVPTAPFEARCPGAIRVVVPPPDPWPVLGKATIVLEIQNEGETAWPGVAAFPRGTVRVDVALGESTGATRRIAELPLPGDVLPGASVRVPVRLNVPLQAGEYRFEFSLYQVKVGPLARCGVAPLTIAVQAGARSRP